MLRVLALLLLTAQPLLAQSADLSAGIAHYTARRWSEAHEAFAKATAAQPRSEYELALTLDPRNGAARRALNALK